MTEKGKSARDLILNHIRNVRSIDVRADGSVSVTLKGGDVLKAKTPAEMDKRLREAGL